MNFSLLNPRGEYNLGYRPLPDMTETKAIEEIRRICELWDNDHIDGYEAMAAIEHIVDNITQTPKEQG